jgi:hypothetical protein
MSRFYRKDWCKPCAVIPRGVAEGGFAPVRSPIFRLELSGDLTEASERPCLEYLPTVCASQHARL